MQDFTKFHIELETSKYIINFQNLFVQNICIVLLYCLLPHSEEISSDQWDDRKHLCMLALPNIHNSRRICGILQQEIQSKETPNQLTKQNQLSTRHWLPCFKTSLQSKHSGIQQCTPEAGKSMATRRKVMIQQEPGSRAQAMQRHLETSHYPSREPAPFQDRGAKWSHSWEGRGTGFTNRPNAATAKFNYSSWYLQPKSCF